MLVLATQLREGMPQVLWSNNDYNEQEKNHGILGRNKSIFFYENNQHNCSKRRENNKDTSQSFFIDVIEIMVQKS